MSLITRCPACETLFKVVPDQLRISEGWVRCGQCDEVFDASAHLVDDVPPVPVAPITAAQVPELIAEPSVNIVEPTTASVPPQFLDLDLDFTEIETESSENLRRVLDFGVEPKSLDVHHEAPELPTPEGWSANVDLQEIETKVEIQSVDVVPEAEVNRSPEVSFLRVQSTKSAWYKPLTRVGMAVLALALLLTLAGQFIFHERDSLVAHEPRLTPWLLAFCAPLGCSLSPLQRIESVSIESSSFARVQDETYLLRFALKNSAHTPLAMPTVELTLTDALDQPVLRRVVRPEELSGQPGVLDPGLARSLEATFLVKLDVASQRMAGYRLLAFYP